MVDVFKKILLEGDAAELSDTDPLDVIVQVAAEGTATKASRDDHKHNVGVASPVALTGATADGTSTSLARADHKHAVGTFTANIDFGGKQANNLVLDNQAANPTGVAGKVYFKTGDTHAYLCTSV
ncbi:hypothetical protein MUP01_04800 [Candidatus Bathyarchaeota archaeon]|nr:hypothetical protein [Candidatus Bathyarchaeota archaeon]